MDPDQKRVITAALDHTELLDDWQYDFINSLAELPSHKPLSEPRASKLDEIRAKLEHLIQ